MNIPRLSCGVSRSRLSMSRVRGTRPSAVLASQRAVAGLPQGCIDILYVPECRSAGPFRECCTSRHEVRCTECHSTVHPPVEEAATLEV
jgi:hypothetical protein